MRFIDVFMDNVAHTEYEFDKYVKRYNGMRLCASSSNTRQFLGDEFAQFTNRIACPALMQRAGCCRAKLCSSEIKYINARLCAFAAGPGLAHLSSLRSDIDCTGQDTCIRHEPSRLGVDGIVCPSTTVRCLPATLVRRQELHRQ